MKQIVAILALTGLAAMAAEDKKNQDIVIKTPDGVCRLTSQPGGCGPVPEGFQCLNRPDPSFPAGACDCSEANKCVKALSTRGGVERGPAGPRDSLTRTLQPTENCYFPPCNPAKEWPVSGSISGAVPAGTMVGVKEVSTGRIIASAPVQNGQFTIPPPRGHRPSGPYQICTASPGPRGMRQECGPVEGGNVKGASFTIEVRGAVMPKNQ